MSFGIWTDDDVETLRKMWGEGSSATEITGAVKGTYTRNAVLGKIHRLGLSRTKTVQAAATTQRLVSQRERREEARRRREEEGRANTHDKRIAGAAARDAERIFPLPNAIICHPVDIMGLEAGLCHFIVDGGDGTPSLYCGADAIPGRSWCPGHHRIVFQPVQQPERKRRAA